MKLITTSVMVIHEHWSKIQQLAESQGTTGSALLRQLMAKELRAAKRDGRLEASEGSAPAGDQQSRGKRV
jgi:hypothetical protein